MTKIHWILILLLQLSLAVENGRPASSHDADMDGLAMVDWLVQKHGGMVSEKIELRRVPRGFGGWDFGVFVTQDVEEDEILMTIPLSSMISSAKRIIRKSDDGEETTTEVAPQSNGRRECETIHNMVLEYQRGESSNYFPYMRYVFEGYGNLWGEAPNTWSDKGKAVLLDTVIGRELAPNREFVERFSYAEDCESLPENEDDDDDDDIEEKMERSSRPPETPVDEETRRMLDRAYVYFLARSRGDTIIPLYDLIPHRNGKWLNAVAQLIPEDRAVAVYADRDIQKGERLYTWRNECEHLGCDDLADFSVTQYSFSLYGVVDDYPRRWLLVTDVDVQEYDMFLELDHRTMPDGSRKLLSRWLTPPPNTYQINWIQAQLHRLLKINDIVFEQAQMVEIPHERDVIIHYYEAYKEALQVAWENRKRNAIEEGDTQTEQKYDSFQQTKRDDLIPPYGFSVCTTAISQAIEDGRQEVGRYQSHYQPIRFTYTEAIDVTTLSLNGWLQTATNFRPHYHEPVVHVAAQYVKEVKRVIFFGGGDNMLLHEIMKYKNLELVVGIELDQTVSRSSFKHFGNSPYFDDPRMQWWFGDASKAINVLPDDYFGSFDIVIVDLLTYIAETIKVKKALSIIDAASLLMKKDGGVIVRNEDFSVRSNTAFAMYTVDLDYLDMPFLCEQSITLGSDSVDFIKAEPIDHGIDVLARPLFSPDRKKPFSASPFDAWKKYRQTIPDGCEASEMDKDLNTCDDDTGKDRYGVLTIIEAENVAIASEAMSVVQSKVAGVPSKFGMLDGSVVSSKTRPNIFTVVFEQGYITTRVYKEQSYISFDLEIWENFNSVNAIVDALVAAVGGNSSESTTIFKIVTTGMPVLRDACRNNFLDTISSSRKQGKCQDEVYDIQNLAVDSTEEDPLVYSELLKAMISHENRTKFSVAVICGKNGMPCSGLMSVEAAKSSNTTGNVLPIFSCDSFEDMRKCEFETLGMISAFVLDHNKTLNAIILDEHMSLQMGQIIHKIFNETKNFDNFLERDLLVMTKSARESRWRQELVDRFRTEMVMFDPAFQCDFALTTTDGQSVRWSLFSSVSDGFFQRLTQGLSAVIRNSKYDSFKIFGVENGMKRLIADFQPTSANIRDSDYDKTDAAKRWKKQVPIAYQAIIQMTVATAQAPLNEGETIFYETGDDDNPFSKTYKVGEVTRVLSDTRYYVKGTDDRERLNEETERPHVVERSKIRKMSAADTDTNRTYHVGDVVLYEERKGLWTTGAIEAVTGNNVYSVYLLDYHKTQLRNVHGERLLVQAESEEYKQKDPPLHHPSLVSAFRNAVLEILDGKDLSIVDSESFHFEGGGALELAFWPQGQAIMKFDGSTGVEINLFLDNGDFPERDRFRKVFVGTVPSLMVTMLDEFPRGYGSVVNLKKDLKDPPIWLSKYDI
ncbi:spermidine synthase [Nitzschia inconspicua]|uniref:Spermidine synthase n=1 Tax=Nitzschia inconspicua TaxID=303405 RepID=A0A9K3KTZ8_9STRA|nr:spermidine synthase [Nitzschia inconspicua]